ncbi:MAG TPA: GNAT family N-acetyltransferase, partial [Longimicrobiaceae bacterium]|nr:GNAT family N-acetyltransferase [Longimicrobiaceae bacterium]
MQTHAAAEYDIAALVRAWNLGYAGYFVPLRFTEEMMRTHLRCGSIDLARSRVWTERDETVGFSFLGVRERRGWIGGFAITPAFRGHGLSYRLFAEHIAEVRASGLTHVQLEVLTPNWARKTYERAGMAVTRTVQVLRGTLQPGRSGGAAREVPGDEALAALGSLHGDFHPAWTREEAWVRGAAQDASGANGGGIVVERGGAPAAALVWIEQGGAVRVLDGAA